MRSQIFFLLPATVLLHYITSAAPLAQAAAIPAPIPRRSSFIIPVKRRKGATMSLTKNASAVFDPTHVVSLRLIHSLQYSYPICRAEY